MKNFYSKTFILFAALLSLCALLFTACQDEPAVPDNEVTSTENFSYVVSDKSAVITEFIGVADEAGNVAVPSTIEGSTVTEISLGAFANRADIKSVTLPATIEKIGAGAFKGCSSLESVNLPYGIKEIAASAFEDCESLKVANVPSTVTKIMENAYKNCSSLYSLTLSQKTESIGAGAFDGCDSLYDVTLPLNALEAVLTDAIKNLTITSGEKLCKEIFEDAENLECISIPVSVTEIEDGCFENCENVKSISAPAYAIRYFKLDNLTSLTIIGTMETIEKGEFEACKKLESITVPYVGSTGSAEGNTHFGYMFGAPDAASNAQYVPETLKSIVITGGTGITSEAFRGLAKVEKIILPRTITAIGDRAFAYCTSLKSVNLPSTITSIGKEALAGTAITTITLPKSITLIPEGLLANCSSLESITIGNKISTVEKSAFDNCTSLNALYISDLEAWCRIDFEDYTRNPLYYANVLYFNEAKVTELVIPESVTEIKNNAFFGCVSIENVVFHSKITSIGDYAFSACSSLLSPKFTDSITEIGVSAFSACDSITEIVLPEGIVSIGAYAFNNCSSLEKVTVNASISELPEYIFRDCSKITEIFLPSSITSVGKSAFERCDGIKHAVVPAPVLPHITSRKLLTLTVNGGEIIPEGSLVSAEKLTEVKFADSITDIGASAFKNCTLLKSIVFGDSSSLSRIGASAFENCSSLITFTIPKNVSEISENAFNGATKLVEIYDLSSLNVTKSSEENGKIAFYALSVYKNKNEISKISFTEDGFVFYVDGDKTVLIGYIGTASSLKLPESFNNSSYSVNQYAFYKTNTVKSISVPVSVTDIDENAFVGCDGIRSVTATLNVINLIPLDSIEQVNIIGGTVIGSEIFKNSKTLKSISIPSTVSSIADDAFSGCSALESIEVNENNTAYRSLDGVLYTKSGKTIICYAVARESDELIILKEVTTVNSGAFLDCEGFSNIYYEGSAQDFAKISIGEGNDALAADSLVYYSEAEPEQEGYFWYYDEDGIPTFW